MFGYYNLNKDKYKDINIMNEFKNCNKIKNEIIANYNTANKQNNNNIDIINKDIVNRGLYSVNRILAHSIITTTDYIVSLV